MAKLRLTKSAADAAAPKAKDYEIRDTTVPGFLRKVTSPKWRRLACFVVLTPTFKRSARD